MTVLAFLICIGIFVSYVTLCQLGEKVVKHARRRREKRAYDARLATWWANEMAEREHRQSRLYED